MVSFLLIAAITLLGVALAGIISDRHFVVIMLAIELIFISSTIFLAYFFSYNQNPDPSAVPMFVAIWSVAAVEVIVLITFYVFMKSRGFDFDITKLSRLKW
jgi:NADH:ubiquinone oxidoreductase subunit K